jgi:hypothetical protein
MPTISRNSGKTSTSKGKYSGKTFGGAKGTPRGRMIASNSETTITVNKDKPSGKGKKDA